MGIDIVYFQSRGVVVHKKTPDEIVQRLHDIYKKTIEDEEVIKKFYNMAVTVTYAGPEEYGKEIIEESAMFEKIIKENKLGDKYK
jgi:tripartite-type tricarboxylate transporter receptor subunit TctC